MRTSLGRSINAYIKAVNTTSWITDEAYKFEFANHIYQNVNWAKQTDKEILELLILSQKIKYSGSHTDKGIQFLIKSGRVKLSEFISIGDVALLRRLQGKEFAELDWDDRGMSFTGLSAWVASLFPEKYYPVPLVGYADTITHLFDVGDAPFPRKGIKYSLRCQPFMKQTEDLLKQYLSEEPFLKVWNSFYENHPELNILPKKKISKLDWVWLVQDFHLFVHRQILGLYKKKPKKIKIQDETEPTVVEGESKLAIHMRRERNTAFIRKVKEKASAKNRMLNCEVCGFSFLEVFGEIGEGFIEAHHKDPLGGQEGNRVTSEKDIALVCSNCHRMLHKGNPVFTLEELKKMIKQK